MPPRREPPEPTVIEMICQFNKLKPPKFKGGSDPLTYEDLLRNMENLFGIMECPKRFRNMENMENKFERKAEFWWGMVMLGAGEPSLTWNQLK